MESHRVVLSSGVAGCGVASCKMVATTNQGLPRSGALHEFGGWHEGKGHRPELKSVHYYGQPPADIDTLTRYTSHFLLSLTPTLIHSHLLAQRFDLVSPHVTFLIFCLSSRSVKRRNKHGSRGWTRCWQQRCHYVCRARHTLLHGATTSPSSAKRRASPCRMGRSRSPPSR